MSKMVLKFAIIQVYERKTWHAHKFLHYEDSYELAKKYIKHFYKGFLPIKIEPIWVKETDNE